MTGATVATTLGASHRIIPDPEDMLLHYAMGEMPCFTDGDHHMVAWCRHSHRGVHLLNEIAIPRKQRRYVDSPRFEFRVDEAFDEVVEACADVDRCGFTWITPELMEGYRRLHRLGYAHSYEAWADGRLVGGCFGAHVGGWVSIESMFHREPNASKAANGRALRLFKERGITLVDANPVEDPAGCYGEEWIPQWRYEALLREAIERPVALTEGGKGPELPGSVRHLLPLARFMRKVGEKVRGVVRVAG